MWFELGPIHCYFMINMSDRFNGQNQVVRRLEPGAVLQTLLNLHIPFELSGNQGN